MARAFSKLGPFYFSFSGGHLTPKITSLVEAIPMDRLLLESDAPDQILTSVDLDNIESIEHVAPLIRDYERVALISDPDKRINEPYRVAILCHTVAQYLSMSPVHLGDVARQNAERVFLGA
jgi:Tat protein secretion system quality control protein TatD with DNase activity